MVSSRKRRRWTVPLFVAVLCVVSALAQAQGGGTAIVGRVTDPAGQALANVSVSLQGTNLSTVTDSVGAYRLAPVPAGEHTVLYVYLGLGSAAAVVKVAEGETVTQDQGLAYSEVVEVRGSPILEGQAKALNTQENAINITNVVAADQIGQFPDSNAAEAMQRIPSVSLLRDQGEGRYVLVRGTEPRLNSTTVNGERLPSPEGAVRNVALDTIPADLLEAIQVSKALTPDMDGDAIGGTVDLVTRRAPLDSQTLATIGGGYTTIVQDSIGLANVTLGRRFNDANTGLLFSASANVANRGSDDFEPEYDDGELDNIGLRDYELKRERYGFTASFDQQLSSTAEFFVRALWDEYKDTEIRREKSDQVSDERIERAVRDRAQESRILSFTAGGSAYVGDTWFVNYRAAWNESREETPDQVTSVFRQKDVVFDPNVSADSIDPNNIQANPQNEDIAAFTFDSIEQQYKASQDRDIVGSIDANRGFYRDTGFSGLWKFGAKARFKTKTQEYNVFDYESEDDLFLTDYLSSWKPPTSFIDGRYDLGQFQNPGMMRDLLASGELEGQKNLEEDLADYTADEDTVAAYVMTELNFGPNMTLLAGLRAERTDTQFEAFELVYDEEGEPSELTPVQGKKNYTELLPMVHLKYRLGEHSNLRAAVTRTFARPNFGDFAPYQLINYEDEEITRGNADLNYTRSWNYDLLFEHYLTSVGIVSAGVFYKTLTDNIFIANFGEDHDGVEFEVSQPVNAESGWLRGIEFAYQNRFASLPKPFDGLGIYFNYTYADSESSYPDRPDTRLPGQSKNVGNLALSYEKSGFSGRISLNYNGHSLFEVGGDPAEDLYVDDHFQIDFSAQQRLGKAMSLYLELVNLGDEPYRVYEGSKDRPRQEEYYGLWGTIGLRFRL